MPTLYINGHGIEAHTHYRAVIREMVNTVVRALEAREPPEFFKMP